MITLPDEVRFQPHLRFYFYMSYIAPLQLNFSGGGGHNFVIKGELMPFLSKLFLSIGGIFNVTLQKGKR